MSVAGECGPRVALTECHIHPEPSALPKEVAPQYFLSLCY